MISETHITTYDKNVMVQNSIFNKGENGSKRPLVFSLMPWLREVSPEVLNPLTMKLGEARPTHDR